jgi:hypothetical protein
MSVMAAFFDHCFFTVREAQNYFSSLVNIALPHEKKFEDFVRVVRTLTAIDAVPAGWYSANGAKPGRRFSRFRGAGTANRPISQEADDHILF